MTLTLEHTGMSNFGCGSAQILEPRLRNRLKTSLVALPSNERDKCLLDVERGAVALTVERKQHIALTTQVDQLLQFVREREIPHRHPHDDATWDGRAVDMIDAGEKKAAELAKQF